MKRLLSNMGEHTATSDERPPQNRNVVLFGGAGSGKTALTWALTGREFSGNDFPDRTTVTFDQAPYHSTYGCFYDFSGETLEDIKVNELIAEINPLAVLFVISSSDNLEIIRHSRSHEVFMRSTKAYKDIDKFLVTTKCDLVNPNLRAKSLVTEFGCDFGYSTSSVLGSGIEELRSALRQTFIANEKKKDLSEVALVVNVLADQLCELVAKNPDALLDIEWRDLERLLSRALAGLGFSISLTPPAKDGGKDIVVNCIAKEKKKKYYIEVKHWRSASQPSYPHVSDFVAVNVRDQTDGGIFISSSGFTQSVYERISELMTQKVHLGQEEKIVSLCQNYVRIRNGTWHPDKPLPDLLFEDTLKSDD
jgi:HJR/Mrr/RecB family endonuclease